MIHAYNITKFNVIEVHTPCAIWNNIPKQVFHEKKKKIVS